jgi:hypothetical protein
MCNLSPDERKKKSGIIPRSHSNNHIYKHTKSTFHIIRFAVTQEIAHDKNRQDEQDHHKDLKVEVHIFTQSPSNEDNQGCVEQSCLDGRSKTVEKGKVDLIVPASNNISKRLSIRSLGTGGVITKLHQWQSSVQPPFRQEEPESSP